jgi:hypothetical protein
MGIKNHTLGETRYITYQLEFPDGEVWTDQEPFWGPLDTYLKLTQFAKTPHICAELLTKGETYWKDQHGTFHIISVEANQRPRKWGTKRKK